MRAVWAKARAAFVVHDEPTMTGAGMDSDKGYPEPVREMGYDQSDVSAEHANSAPDVTPTVESVEKACDDTED